MKTVLKITLLIAPFFLFYTITLFLLKSHINEDNFLYGSVKKRERLQKTNSKKMVFIGGSSMAFGLNSKKIEEALGYAVINMGLHADVGLRCMLLESEEYLKEGDVVVVGAEYEQFLNYFYGRQALVALLFDINKDYYKKLDIESSVQLFEPMHKYALRKVSYNLLNSQAESTEIYSKNSFNEYGDVVAHWNKEPQKYIYNYSLQNVINPDSFSFLHSFKENMQSRNIKFILIPPPIQQTQFDMNKEIIKEIQDKLKRHNLPYIESSNTYTFADSLFFDTPYHLNKQGVDIRTKYLISDIQNYLSQDKVK